MTSCARILTAKIPRVGDVFSDDVAGFQRGNLCKSPDTESTAILLLQKLHSQHRLTKLRYLISLEDVKKIIRLYIWEYILKSFLSTLMVNLHELSGKVFVTQKEINIAAFLNPQDE